MPEIQLIYNAFGKQYKRKIDRLECYKYEIENAEQLKAGGDDENTNQKEN